MIQVLENREEEEPDIDDEDIELVDEIVPPAHHFRFLRRCRQVIEEVPQGGPLREQACRDGNEKDPKSQAGGDPEDLPSPTRPCPVEEEEFDQQNGERKARRVLLGEESQGRGGKKKEIPPRDSPFSGQAGDLFDGRRPVFARRAGDLGPGSVFPAAPAFP